MDFQKIGEQILIWMQNIAPKLIGALLILAIGWWLSNLLASLMRRGMDRAKADAGIVSFLCSLTRAALKIIVCITAAAQLGMEVTSIIAALGAAGLAVGLALKDNMANIASGAQIIFTKPFRVGDYLVMEGVEGTVTRIEIMYTTLTTFDNKEIIIPNSKMIVSIVTNCSAMETRRLDLSYSISYNDDIAAAKQLLNDMVSAEKRILQTPEPLIAVGELKEDGVALVVKVWCKSEDYWPVYYDMQEHVKLEFDKAGIAFPCRRIEIQSKEGK